MPKTVKSIRKSVIREVLSIIYPARDAATMKNANFFPSPFDDPPPILKKDVDSYIKEKTLLFRETWIVDPLDMAINMLVKELNR